MVTNERSCNAPFSVERISGICVYVINTVKIRTKKNRVE